MLHEMEALHVERVHSPPHQELAGEEFNLRPGEHYYENQSSQQIEQVLVLE
jgi:hypothetical protein